MNSIEPKLLPESVETLSEWKLPNDDSPFNHDAFLEGFDEHAKEANKLFKLAFAK